MDKIQFKRLFKGELNALCNLATIQEAVNLKSHIEKRLIDGFDGENCIYGAMTGSCGSERAQFIKANFDLNNKQAAGVLGRFLGLSPIEILIDRLADIELKLDLVDTKPKQSRFAQHIYNAITGTAPDMPYFENLINELFENSEV